MPSADPVLTCERLVKIYESSTGRVEAVRGVDLEIEQGERVAVSGPSGSGKSSLLRMLGGLDQPTAGRVTVTGVDLTSMSPRRRSRLRATLLTHVYQRPTDNLLEHLTAEQQLHRLARPPKGPSVGETLAELGLEHCRTHRPSAMSGGEQQRLAFARAVVAGHSLVIADEPTAQLDSRSADSILDVISALASSGVTVLVASHDPRVHSRMDRIVTLRDGALASITTAGSELAVIDRAGRLQLPPEVQTRYPGRTARITFDEKTGRLTIDPP